MNILKKVLPHVVAVVVFALISVIYFSPVLDGKKLRQYDIVQYGGAAKEVSAFRAQTGEEAMWTNSMFGGMPAYQISVAYPNNWTKYLNRVLTLGLPHPVAILFVALLGFYIMLLCFKVDPWLSIVGALVYGLSTYFLIIIGAGHNTKMRTLAFMPAIIGGLYLVYHRQKLWLGVIVTCLALALQIFANHFQITYYTAIVVLIFLIFETIHVFKERSLRNNFIKGSAGLLLALTLAVGVNITNMLLTMEYTPYSTRGLSDLRDTDGDKTSGLDKSYILNNYSYGVAETMNLFIPDFAGGGSVSKVSDRSPFYEAMIANGVPKQQATQIAKQVPLYWGGQDGGTSGPVYIGAVAIFLFVLGLFVVKGRVKWWLLTATLLSIVLAWGRHCMFVSDLFINYFPGYNKFRTVSMILVIAEMTIPLLGILAVKELLCDRLSLDAKKNAIKKSLYIVGGIALFFVVLPGLLFSFSSPADGEMSKMGYPDWLVAALPDTREYVLRMDALRSLFFVFATSAVLWFTVGGKIKLRPAYFLIAVLVVADLWLVDKRYLNNDRFAVAKEVSNPVKQSAADGYILRDTTLDYRVLNLNNPFNDATTSYFHKSIGGYHGAKMKRYQELIDHRLSGEIKTIIAGLQSAKTPQDVGNIFAACPALNMLNTRYVIYNPEQPALDNPAAIGNAWPVAQIRWVDDADAEIAALSDLARFDPAREAVVDKRFEESLKDFSASYDSTANIRLTSYKPNHLVYEYRSQTPQLAVFSEIYYDKGWDAYIDDRLVPHVRANYVLRAVAVPEGSHRIEFKFASKTYAMGEKISLAGSIAIVLLVLGRVAWRYIR
jgi:hypothetical protein